MPFAISSWAEVSDERDVAIALFMEHLPRLFERHSPLLRSLLGFLIVCFDFNVKPESLPAHHVYEPDEIARIRTNVVSRFTLEYSHALRPRPALMITDAQAPKMLKLGTVAPYLFFKDPSADLARGKASRTKRRRLTEYAIGTAQRILHTSIEYRCESIPDTIALLTGIPAQATSAFETLDNAGFRIGYDDATDDVVHGVGEKGCSP